MFAAFAKYYTENGIKVFPVDRTTKAPLVEGGFHAATTDQETIEQWMMEFDDALIGTPCGEWFSVVDCDFKNGESAYSSFGKLVIEGMNVTVEVTTPSGGKHYYFQPNDVTRRIKCMPGIDFLGVNGFVILPDQRSYKIDGFISDFIEKITSNKLPSLSPEVMDVLLENKEEEKGRMSYENKKDKDTYIDNGDNVLLNRFGKLEFEPGTLTTKDVNAIFYNREVQMQLGDFIGIEIPWLEDRTGSFRSILPRHKDNSPSMATRWSGCGKYLIVKDFSNHFNIPEKFCDYDLVRLYATIMYDKPIRRLKAPEWSIWFMRLLYDSGMIEIDLDDYQLDTDGEKLFRSEQQLADSISILMGLKDLREEFNGETAFSDKFAVAWSGLAPSSVNRIKKKFMSKGWLVKERMAETHHFAPTVFSVKLKGLNEMAQTEQEYEKEVEKKFPNIGTYFGTVIDDQYIKTIHNFAEDFEIENIPDPDVLAVSVGVSEKFQQIKPGMLKMPMELVNFTFDVVRDDEMDNKMLVCYFDSNEYDKSFENVKDDFELDNDDPEKSFILSYDYDDDHDLDVLSFKFNEYLPVIKCYEDISGNYDMGVIEMLALGNPKYDEVDD